MRLAILLICCAAALGQTSAPPSEQKPKDQDYGLDVGTKGKQLGSLDVLSDTQGVDFGPYLERVLADVRENWYHLIPESAEMKKGKLAIEFKIAKEGTVAEMRLVASSGCDGLDRPAWGSITASNPFRPLPSEFTGPYLALRLRFSYNPDLSGPDSSGKGCSGPAAASSPPKTKSGVAISITAPVSGAANVLLGGSIPVTAIVTGMGTQENTVEWSITGFGCSGTSCGEMTKDSYHAPTVLPNPPFVTLTATAKADPGAKASITVHIIESAAVSVSPGAAIQQAAQAAVANHTRGALDILSNTHGIDFGPYLQSLIGEVRKNWYRLIPESAATKKGKLAIEFAITKDGQIADMRLVASSGDAQLDRAAWGGITACDPLKPLPEKFTGPYLALRMRFYYNPDKSDLDGSGKGNSPEPVQSKATVSISSAPSKSGIVVSISVAGGLQVPVRESKVFAATVTGTKKQAVKWRISGLACSNSACGTMVGNLYLAPSVLPNPPDVTVTAISKADPTANASVTLHIVDVASH